MQTIIAFIHRRILATVFLLLYFLWWGWVFKFYHAPHQYPQICGAANAGLIGISILLFITYLVAFLMLALINKEQKRRDFSLALCFVVIPVLIAIIDLFS